MGTQEYPTLNGQPQSWANIGVTFDTYDGPGIDDVDLKALKFKAKVEKGVQRKTGGQIKGFTVGMPSYEGSFTPYSDGWNNLLTVLAKIAIAKGYVDATGAARLSLVPFSIHVQHTPVDQSYIREVHLEGCYILEDGNDFSESNEADTSEIPIQITKIYRLLEDGTRTTIL